VGDLTFGILICLDSTYGEPARIMAARGAAALFVPTNNGMPPARGGPELVVEARCGDIARAIESGVSVVRADVAGRTGDLVSYGSSGIVDRNGTVLGSARPLEADMVVADISTVPRARANTRRLLTTEETRRAHEGLQDLDSSALVWLRGPGLRVDAPT
jgi:predicted amidohydrolase